MWWPSDCDSGQKRFLGRRSPGGSETPTRKGRWAFPSVWERTGRVLEPLEVPRISPTPGTDWGERSFQVSHPNSVNEGKPEEFIRTRRNSRLADFPFFTHGDYFVPADELGHTQASSRTNINQGGCFQLLFLPTERWETERRWQNCLIMSGSQFS